jgi:ATP-binding cassette subfamily F protein 3
MMEGPTNHLSGGWRMRLAIAQSLFITSDLLLMDEPSNHLDTVALIWLSQYLSESKNTFIVVSHDRGFLDDVSTDIILFEHKKLSYHVGNYSDFQQQQDEKHARQAQILDASERKRAKAISFIEQQQKSSTSSKKYQDPKKQRQAKMMKEKKLDRIGNYRDDGKRYKLFSIKKLSEEYSRCPEKVDLVADEPVARLKFFNPTWPPGITPGSPLMQADDMSFSYSREAPWVLQNLTLDINRGSKVSIVGNNGSGKSTLMNIFTGKLSPEDEDLRFKGKIWTNPCLRIGHVTQHSVELLDVFGSLTVEEYGEKELLSRNACAEISSSAGGSKNIRQYLGAFGLGGPHAKRLVGTLSGGERMRLCFATVMAEQPHLLCLDEPSNHLGTSSSLALVARCDANENYRLFSKKYCFVSVMLTNYLLFRFTPYFLSSCRYGNSGCTCCCLEFVRRRSSCYLT